MVAVVVVIDSFELLLKIVVVKLAHVDVEVSLPDKNQIMIIFKFEVKKYKK